MSVYKILLPAEWARLKDDGSFSGSPFDHATGYIHLSTREQVVGTAARRFADQGALVLVEVDARTFGDQLRWEMMPNGGPYPHLYGPLTLHAVVAVHEVPGAAAIDGSLTEADSSS